MKKTIAKASESQIAIYKTSDGQTKVNVHFDRDTVWLTQNALATLFKTTKQNISLHINNIFSEGELNREATVKDFLTVQNEGGVSLSPHNKPNRPPLLRRRRARRAHKICRDMGGRRAEKMMLAMQMQAQAQALGRLPVIMW